jgi:hypothetical protein
MAADDRHAALVREALRLNDRYLQEIVVGWGLCPWAERALREGQVRRRVFVDEAPAPEAVLAFADELAADPGAAIGLALFPRLAATPPAFDAFAERLRRARRPAAFLIAAFHPFAAHAFSTAPQLVSFIRRTPDPTLQFVRASLLDGLGAGVSSGVAHQNFEAVTARGAAALDAALRDIRRDRDQTYARLAGGQPSESPSPRPAGRGSG